MDLFFFFFFFLQNTSYSYGRGRPTTDFKKKVIPRPWPVDDVLAAHHCSVHGYLYDHLNLCQSLPHGHPGADDSDAVLVLARGHQDLGVRINMQLLHLAKESPAKTNRSMEIKIDNCVIICKEIIYKKTVFCLYYIPFL